MSSEQMKESFEKINLATKLTYGVQRDILIDKAFLLDARLGPEFERMIREDGWSTDELIQILEQIEPGSTDDVNTLVAQRLEYLWRTPESKKSRRRENWEAFLKGLGGVGAGLYAVAQGMAAIGGRQNRP